MKQQGWLFTYLQATGWLVPTRLKTQQKHSASLAGDVSYKKQYDTWLESKISRESQSCDGDFLSYYPSDTLTAFGLFKCSMLPTQTFMPYVGISMQNR